MKKMSETEIKNSKNGIMINVSPALKYKMNPNLRLNKGRIKVYPFYEEKTFKKNNKVFPGFVEQNNCKYMVMVVKDQIVCFSDFKNASSNFKKFVENH